MELEFVVCIHPVSDFLEIDRFLFQRIHKISLVLAPLNVAGPLIEFQIIELYFIGLVFSVRRLETSKLVLFENHIDFI